jgi:hypothetical protein
VTEETRKIAVTLHVKLVKIIDMPVSILAEADIDESGDVYNDAVAERMKPAMDLLCGWDDWTIEEEDHEQVEEWKMVPIGEAAELVKKETPAMADDTDALKAKVITQAFVAGQMDAQLKHADEATRPSLELLQAKTYAMAQESLDALIAAVTKENDSANNG